MIICVLSLPKYLYGFLSISLNDLNTILTDNRGFYLPDSFRVSISMDQLLLNTHLKKMFCLYHH